MRTLGHDYLLMPGIADQVHLRGAINASYAQLVGQGLSQAKLTVFDKMLDALKQRRVEQSFLADLDPIRPERLTRTAMDRLRGLSEFVDPGLDADEVRRGHAQLQLIRSRGAARIAQDVPAACEQAVRDAFSKLQESLPGIVSASPLRARKLTAEIRTLVQAMVFSAPNAEPQAKLRKILRILDQIEGRRQTLPAATFANAVQQLAAAGQRQHALAVAALAEELAEVEFRRQKPRLQSHLDELATRMSEFVQRLTQVRKELEERSRLEEQEGHVSQASVVYPLPGRDESELLTGMLARTNCADLNALGERLLDLFETRLRDESPRLSPHLNAVQAPFAELVRGVEAEALATLFSRLVDECMGAGSTIYEAIDREGIQKVVVFLFRRAGSTVDLADRDVEQFNISPLRLTIVRLPPPLGQRDPALREKVIKMFEGIGHCTFTDGAADDRVLTVVRAHIGWPIGIEASNRALLDRYARAGSHGHRPHLVEFVPDAPTGAISRSVVELAEGQRPEPANQSKSPAAEEPI